jgi:hypothetical protein
METIKRIIRGCGSNPSTDYLVAFILLGALAGTNGALSGPLTGMSIATLLAGPAYLLGAYERAVEAEGKHRDN